MFEITLSWSRHQYVEFVFDQKIPTWLSYHEHAFQFFGGVVESVVLNNLKVEVLKADLQDPVLGEPFRRLAQHFGFLISPNRIQDRLPTVHALLRLANRFGSGCPEQACQRDLRLSRINQRLARYGVVILDDIGYLQ